MEPFVNELDSLEGKIQNTQFLSSCNLNEVKAIINHEAMILMADIDGVITFVNDKCGTMVGYDPKELIGQHTRIFKTGFHTKAFYHDLWNTLLSGKIWRGEMNVKRKEGTSIWNFISIFPLLDENQRPYQFLSLRRDITDQKKFEEWAHKKEKQFNFVFEMVDDAVGCFDRQGNLLYVNTAFEKLLGYHLSKSGIINVFDYLDQADVPKVEKIIAEVIQNPDQTVKAELKFWGKDHALLICEVKVKSYLQDPFIKGIVFTYRDITKQKKNYQKIHHWENYDSLTGLPNQRNCLKKLDEEFTHSKESDSSFAVFMVEIDDFKYVNDTFGYVKGNELLKQFSLRLQSALSSDLYLSRMGGDEFILLLSNIGDFEDIHKTGEKLLTAIRKDPFMIQGEELFLTASIGISIFPYSGDNAADLLKNAELAMYHAKKNGKNQVEIFSPILNIISYKQFMLRNDAKKALLKNEFSMYYQPRIHPVTKKMVSAEALIRWSHPVWGLVSPDEFIPMAEESGLIIDIGQWIIKSVCDQLKKWEEEKRKVKKISINLSSLQLLQDNFTEMVASILHKTGVPSKLIEFEITESVLIEKEDQVLKVISQLADLGITFALDDFGTGYSSFHYLKRYPCETIKIDKILIKDVVQDPYSYEIIAAIINLCHKLKKSVVAEGVETKEQLDMLEGLGCDEIQGYFFSKPVDHEEFLTYLQDYNWGNRGVMDKASFIKLRKYFRVPLSTPLVGSMTIEKIGKKKINIGSSEVLIKDIGPGGLRFHSSLKLPVKKDITLRFSTEIFSETLHVKGRIVWHRELEDQLHQYGVEFIVDEKKRESLIKILSHLQIQLKSSTLLPQVLKKSI